MAKTYEYIFRVKNTLCYNKPFFNDNFKIKLEMNWRVAVGIFHKIIRLFKCLNTEKCYFNVRAVEHPPPPCAKKTGKGIASA